MYVRNYSSGESYIGIPSTIWDHSSITSEVWGWGWPNADISKEFKKIAQRHWCKTKTAILFKNFYEKKFAMFHQIKIDTKHLLFFQKVIF